MKITEDAALSRIRQSRNTGNSMRRVMSRGVADSSDELEVVRRVKIAGGDRLYLVKDNDTIVVTPADDQLPAVLAEFETTEEVELNPVMLDWITATAEQVRLAQIAGYTAPEEASSNEGGLDLEDEGNNEEPGEEPGEETEEETEEETPTPEYIAPLLGGIQWLQDRPFNNNLVFEAVLAPKKRHIGSFFRNKVGCPALAAAQVVYYLAKRNIFKAGCVATPAFVSQEMNGYSFKVPANERCPKFKFSQMLDVYSYRSGNTIVDYEYTETQANAVAELCAYIGMAGESFYSPSCTAMWVIEQLVPVFKYALGIDVTGYYPKNKFSNIDEERIKESLRKELPVIMSGTTVDNGHCFVCDGYRESDDTYHFNWGYGPGRGDGWFKMMTFNPIETDDNNPEAYSSYSNWTNYRNYIIITPPDPLKYDINKDGLINMQDVTLLINLEIATEINTVSATHKKYVGASIRPVWKGSGRPTEQDYVDLNLPSGTLWATKNIGAEDEDAYGDYIAYRRTEAISPYVYDEELDYDFTVDDVTGTAQDAAKANWGGNWQLPSFDDFQELKEWCDFDLTAETTLEHYIAPNGRDAVREIITRYIDVSRKRRKHTPAETEIYDQTGTYPDIPDGVIRIPLAGIKWNTSKSDVGTKGVYWTGKNGRKIGSNYYAETVDISFFIPEKVDLGDGRIFDTLTLADLNYDGVIDKQDIELVIDRILGR